VHHISWMLHVSYDHMCRAMADMTTLHADYHCLSILLSFFRREKTTPLGDHHKSLWQSIRLRCLDPWSAMMALNQQDQPEVSAMLQ